MSNEEIMNQYTEALMCKFKNRPQRTDFDSVNDFFIYLCEQKENAYSIAMDCLDKILSPELKVFVRNLCYNKLGYPDEPIFYKIFGKYPKVGDKVSVDDLVERGFDIKEIEEWVLKWSQETNYVEKETLDGKNFFVIKSLFEMEDENVDEKFKNVRAMEEIEKLMTSVGDKEFPKDADELLGRSGIRKTWRI